MMPRLMFHVFKGMESTGGADEDVVRLIVLAVEQQLRNLVTALLMDRNGYRLRLGAPYAVGTPAPDPWLLNSHRRKHGSKRFASTESLNPEHPVPVPIARPTQKEAEHAAMMETACGARSDHERECQIPRDPVSLFDLMSTMEKVYRQKFGVYYRSGITSIKPCLFSLV